MTKPATVTYGDLPRAEIIARLNDQLRKTGTGGTVVITQGVRRITGFDASVLDEALANYAAFDPENDHQGERNFGCMTLFGYDLLFKIDYYDKALKYGSEDPADPEKTSRVLTVLLASEW